MKNSANFQSIFESAPGLYLILATDHTIIGASESFLEVTMTQRSEIIGKGCTEVFPNVSNYQMEEHFSDLITLLDLVIIQKKQLKRVMQKYKVRMANGSFEERHWNLIIKPVLNESKEIECIVLFVEDFTQHQKLLQKSKANEWLLQSSIESLNDIIFLSLDKDFKYLSFNKAHAKAVEQFYGIKLTLGMNMLDYIADDDVRKKARENFNRAFSGERHSIIEKYGEVGHVFFETRYNPIINENNEVIGATALAFNVTDRIKAELEIAKVNKNLMDAAIELLRSNLNVNIADRIKAETELVRVNKELAEAVGSLMQSNALFSKLFNLSPGATYISRYDNLRIYDVNSTFLKMFGFSSKDEVIGQTAEELNLVQDPEFGSQIFDQLKLNGRVDNMEGQIKTKDGLIKWVSCSVHLIEMLEVKYILSTAFDISKIKEQGELLEDQSNKMSLINQELETFSYSVSHDLKAPLRALQGFSRALQENYHKSFDGESLRWLGFIEYNANRMGVLIDDILNFSRVGRASLVITEVDMHAMAKNVFDQEQSYYKSKSIKFTLEQIPNTMADEIMMKTVWQNLISNALKYSSKNEEIDIRINGKIENGFQIYSIKDNGVGFDEKYQEKLFSVFQRLHPVEEFEGTGVGLAITGKIINKHDGWIKATGKVGEGAEFIFAIPINSGL